MYEPHESQVTSSRHRVTAISRHREKPEPAAVIITVYLPLESRWVRGIRSCGEWNRRDHRRRDVADVAVGPDLFGARTGDCDVAGGALLEQQLGRLDDRLGVKPRAHRAVEQRVVDSDQGHPLMMGHVGADDRDDLAFGHSGGRVVERLVPSEAAETASSFKSFEVLRGRFRVNHCS